MREDHQWVSVKDLLPPTNDRRISKPVLIWGSIIYTYDSKKEKGVKSFLIGTCHVHPTSGAFWRAEGWLVEATHWSFLPSLPDGEELVQAPEPRTTTG